MKCSHFRFVISATPNLVGSPAAELAVAWIAVAERGELRMHPLGGPLIQRLAVVEAGNTRPGGEIRVAHTARLAPGNMHRGSLFTRTTSQKNRNGGQFHQ